MGKQDLKKSFLIFSFILIYSQETHKSEVYYEASESIEAQFPS